MRNIEIGGGIGIKWGIVAALLQSSVAARPVLALNCELMDCGSNTPVLYGSPIQGLSLGGDVSSVMGNTVKLEPLLTRVRQLPAFVENCPDGAELFVRDGELRATARAQGIHCRGYSLVGMAFSLVVPCVKASTHTVDRCNGKSSEVVRVRIDSIGAVSDWVLPTNGAKAIPTYRLVWEELPGYEEESGDQTPAVGKSICPKRTAWMEDWQVPMRRKPDDPVRKTWKEATDHLLIVQGETYGKDAAIDKSGREWFNLACAGTAISKMRLLGYDPSTDTSSPPERQATLKMISGRYRAETSYTVAGTPLKWWHSTKHFDGDPDPSRWNQDIVEAHWSAAGATCLSHRRTWRRRDTINTSNDAYVRMLTPERKAPVTALVNCASPNQASSPSCTTRLAAWERISIRAALAGVQPCPTSSRFPASPDIYWVTYPVDHVAHTP